LAGIVPISKSPYDYGFIFDDCLIPVGKQITAVELAIAECLMAGCETIWLVCHRSMQPLIKKCIGESYCDPTSVGASDYYPARKLRQIQIYYVPIHPKDQKKRDCLSYSVLYGALSAFLISIKMSKWLIPDKYYVSFPWGVYDYEILRKVRNKISHPQNFSITHGGKSVRDGLLTSFTFDAEDYKVARDNFKRLSRDNYLERDEHSKIKFDFSVDKIFNSVKMGHNVNVEEFYEINTWEKYSNFMSSGLKLERSDAFFKGRWNKIGEDNASDEDEYFGECVQQDSISGEE